MASRGDVVAPCRAGETEPTVAEVVHAVADGAFLVAEQPIVSLAHERVVGTESLVRWQHPRLGLLAPARFLPLVHELGLLPAVDLLVLRTTCGRLADDPSRPTASVNVSRAWLLRREFVDAVLGTLREHELGGHRVLLELSEELSLDDLELVRDELLVLRRAGVQLALDDMGTGETTLQHVRMLGPAWVKVDRSLVSGLDGSPERLRTVELVIDLARTTGAGVTAEGIEREAEAAALVAVGCERGQGWLFGRPVLHRTTDRISDHGIDQ